MELLSNGFPQWLCKHIREYRLDSKVRVIEFPFRPLGDDQLVIYLREKDGRTVISDEGETLSQLFIKFGILPGELDKVQIELIRYACDIHGVEWKGSEFRLDADANKEHQFQQVVDFFLAILPVFYTIILKQEVREKSFAQRVYNVLAPEVKQLGGNLIFDRKFSFEIGGETVQRKIEFYSATKSGHKVGRAIFQKQSIATTTLTWQHLDRVERGELTSKQFSPNEFIEKIALYDENIPKPLLEPLDWFETKSFCFQTEIHEAARAFVGVQVRV